MRFQCEHLLAASANGGSSTRGGHQCAHRQRGARRRRTKSEVGAAQAAVAQRMAAQAAVAQRVGGASEQSDALTLAFL